MVDEGSSNCDGSQYSIWLDCYAKCRDGILEDMREYQRMVELITDEIHKNDIILPIENVGGEISASMGFVDGGEGIRELLGVVIFMIRASCLLLDKEEGEYKNQRFLRDMDMNIIDYDEHTKERIEFLRGAMEFDMAIKSITTDEPEFIFIDGSLYVNCKKTGPYCKEFRIYRKKLIRILQICKQNSIHLVGISEDTRSRLLSNYLFQRHNIKLPNSLTDSAILRLIAGNTCYRTITYIPQPGMDMSSLSVSFPTVYVQPTPIANPIRIDVPHWEEDIDRIIQIIVELSAGSRQHGYPIPLHLVHLDAEISSKHADWSTTQLISYLSKKDPYLYDTILRGRRRVFRPK